MNAETRICQNCKNQFVIEPEDFDFYAKIKVPPPTFCPDCRMKRRFAWRNEHTFYHSVCSLTGKKIITGISPDKGLTVYDRDVWWSDSWDASSYCKEYDATKPFFLQFSELFKKVPFPSVFNSRTINCLYSNHTGEIRNGYLIWASWGGENLAYGTRIQNSKDSLDVFTLINSELCYEGVNLTKCYKTAYSQNSENCSDSYFLFECKGCTNCFGCTNLRNKSYYIFNQPYSREDYLKKLEEFKVDSYGSLESLKNQFADIKKRAIRKYANIINSQQVTGDNINNSFNCKNCFDISLDLKDSKYIQNALQLVNGYDGYGVGAQSELMYEMFDAGIQGSLQCFGGIIYGGANIFYSYNCHGCNNLFGCVGLRNKEYCILNKQYSKEDFLELRGKIIEHMKAMPYCDKGGRIYGYGEFFPVELSPFAYNETVAKEYFPLTKEEALKEGYAWKDPELRNYSITKYQKDIPDSIKGVSDDILSQVIECAHQGTCDQQCATAFKIIPEELSFYRRMNLPLPRLCSNCRHYQRLAQRNPLKLWKRKCQCAGMQSENWSFTNTVKHFHSENRCPNEFETSYAPDRKEIVYCEACYQSEIV
jgi:hypothetical protein